MNIKITIYLCLILGLSVSSANAQGLNAEPDTLLFQPFQGSVDPGDTMLPEPTGSDEHWVNFDQDKKQGQCVANGITPLGWYWESDLGATDPSTTDNYAFTSCSFLKGLNPQNRNYLITPPLYIPNATYALSWRSLSYYGPDYMDGYHVLVSTGLNTPNQFTDTLFGAAQTVDRFQVGSLDLNDYLFSPGYIHANQYTNTDYFFVDEEPNGIFYHGKLEPHSVSLAPYAGKQIYIAFLHDSYDDFQLQVDDILVLSPGASAVATPVGIDYFEISPNPAGASTQVHWVTAETEDGVLNISDINGKTVYEKGFSPRADGQITLETSDWAPGVYYCHLATTHGQAVRKILKMN